MPKPLKLAEAGVTHVSLHHGAITRLSIQVRRTPQILDPRSWNPTQHRRQHASRAIYHGAKKCLAVLTHGTVKIHLPQIQKPDFICRAIKSEALTPDSNIDRYAAEKHAMLVGLVIMERKYVWK